MKLVSWNVNGIRAGVKKGFVEKVNDMGADVICLQETKAQDDQVIEALVELEGYHVLPYSAVKKGYSGTAILTRKKPISITYGMGIPEHDDQGRLIIAEYEDFYLGTTYVPNSGNGLVRLDYRITWDTALLKHLKKLEEKKPVIICGDFNVCHREIDIARPKANYNKSAGYMQVEIDGMDNYTNAGFKDSFREFHPDEVKYSWWSLRGGARSKNVGWRLDYFLVSESIMNRVKQADIWTQIEGSDHCPVILELK
ncbi:MAG: exodeoxyribonuclease III [Crocinitomicaceae bacterium]|nr:exodeoxyribonuclease III [Crocinitomicaceae bacterium]|tara:strand:- start:16243 stop:17004 length:762 start_codon:yes stop_codon:yes gene_type:complete